MMKRALIFALALGALGTAAQAGCVAEYKAKRGNQYVHSTISVPDSSCNAGAVSSILSSQGYTNVVVVSVTKS